ncbi:hypothetical protein [Massilia sp. TWP1-3-3]|uniref:hypothetical protein n=1 Tax=Massilia sp. TWP1-3-3 TaxID=2804573 RepID=UPI003CF271E1
MTKALLIFLMLLLPWQSLAAMERNFAHTGGNGQSARLVVEHMAEHAVHVLHHHDDDGDDDASAAHLDDSTKSVQHLADYDQAGHMNCLFPSFDPPHLASIARLRPALMRDPFHTRSTLPLLRPPRLPA